MKPWKKLKWRSLLCSYKLLVRSKENYQLRTTSERSERTMDSILNTILKDTYTLSSLKHRLNILKSHLLKAFFGTQQNQDFEAKDSAWLNSLPPTFYQNFNKDNIYDLFSQVEKQKESLKNLTIYLTFEPDDFTVTQIGAYARRSFGDYLLLDIKYDPNLIAGAAVVWKGIYKDYSLRAQLAEKQSEILQSFKKFLR